MNLINAEADLLCNPISSFYVVKKVETAVDEMTPVNYQNRKTHPASFFIPPRKQKLVLKSQMKLQRSNCSVYSKSRWIISWMLLSPPQRFQTFATQLRCARWVLTHSRMDQGAKLGSGEVSAPFDVALHATLSLHSYPAADSSHSEKTLWTSSEEKVPA